MNNCEETIWFHADDYGVTGEQSRRILDCYEQGVLNSVSVLPNSDALGEALQILNQTDSEQKIRRVLHINLVEGRPVSASEDVGLLVDERGMFARSFVQLWMWNYIKRGKAREKLKTQLKREITAQLDAVTKRYDYHITAVDSHQHYHMIPIVFDSLMEVLEEQKSMVKEIRIPVDPLRPLQMTRGLIHRVPVINWVKWGILRLYTKRNSRVLQKKGIEIPVFFGIFFTCDMKLETVQALLPAYKQYASEKNRKLELMFHPGNLTAQNELLDERRDEMAKFYLSQNRFEEAECLRKLKK